MLLTFRTLNKNAIYHKIFKYTSSPYGTKTSLQLWHEDISTDIKLKIEDHWANEVVSLEKSQKNDVFYVLPMFPYPSGNLHMGHVRVYSISDTIARIFKLSGRNVIHPMGWDAFGLPAENAAIERNILPHHWTKSNIHSMKKQLLKLGFDFDWSREFSTCDPEYYKWTQYIFLKLFENGLAYQCKAKVNWDPVDQTVLAEEQVDEFGCSWRSGAKVETKILTQWFVKTTKYAKQLYDGLNDESLEDWKDIVNLQKHWIGECDGIVVAFEINIGNEKKIFDVWSTEPYKFIHGQFLTMKSDHILLSGVQNLSNEEIKCFNPITNTEMPIYVTNDASYPSGRDVYIASPSTDGGDYELAELLKLNVKSSTGSVDMDMENQRAIDIAKRKNVGGYFVSSKLKDWLISRQRYWGTPIPIIHCSQCGPVPVPYEDLPIILPASESEIHSLPKLDSWANCICPKCSNKAKRETDTMDTFVDSSWYYYRFLDPKNDTRPFAREKLTNKIPVDIYIGGKEHAVLHLYYARFISHFLHALGWTPTAEPFKKLVVQGMVMGQSYKLKSGKYILPSDVEKIGKEYRVKCSGEPVLVQWEKMSKSKYNGVNPENLLEMYGCDTTRLLILADVPPETSRHWSDATLPGVLNWQHRIWLTMRDYLKHKNAVNSTSKKLTKEEFQEHEKKLWDARNYLIATATYHFKHTHKLSVGISRLQSLTSALRNKVPPEIVATSKEFEQTLASLIIMLAPVTPHFCSELWSGFISAPNRISNDIIKWDKSLFDQSWPKVDDQYGLSFQCKVDGFDRSDLKIKSIDLDKLDYESALKMALNEDSVKKYTKHGILRTKFELYPGCRAILHIFTNRNQNTEKENDVENKDQKRKKSKKKQR